MLSTPGRVILALLSHRHDMTEAELCQRIDGAGDMLAELELSGGVEKRNDRWSITNAGRATLEMR